MDRTGREDNNEMKKDSDIFVMASNNPPKPVDPGVRRQILGYNEEIMTCRVWFEKGAQGTPHTHPHSQVTYVEQGQFLFRVGDETRLVGPGDSVLIAPGALHGAECIEAGTLLDNFSPVRADFLEDGK